MTANPYCRHCLGTGRIGSDWDGHDEPCICHDEPEADSSMTPSTDEQMKPNPLSQRTEKT